MTCPEGQRVSPLPFIYVTFSLRPLRIISIGIPFSLTFQHIPTDIHLSTFSAFLWYPHSFVYIMHVYASYAYSQYPCNICNNDTYMCACNIISCPLLFCRAEFPTNVSVDFSIYKCTCTVLELVRRKSRILCPAILAFSPETGAFYMPLIVCSTVGKGQSA